MTKPIGSNAMTVLMLVLACISTSSWARVNASLDRNQVAMGDTLNLTITATEDNEDVSNMDLRPLLSNFEVLRQSTRSSTNIVNGQRTHKRQLILDISPLHTGELTIPPMRVGQERTQALMVLVGKAATVPKNEDALLFEAEVDREQVYVQGQLLLTLRLQQAINLENRSISDLELNNAFVIPLEQKSFQRTINGRPWLVYEVRYAIFPEQSGTLEIPAQTFSARESVPRRSLFDSGTGRRIRELSKALSIEVLPRPGSYPAQTWLPARNLSLEETWSTPPEQLQAGESATRTINIRGEGLQGAQLPPVLFPATDGVKFYPDQPSINDMEIGTGLLGGRQDSAALVPTRAGELEIPEVRIPWWDIEAEELRYAVLPARKVNVAAAETASTTASPDPVAVTSADTSLAQDSTASPYWQWLALFSTVGWLCTLIWLLLRRPGKKPVTAEPEERTEPQAFKQLIASCAGDNASLARNTLVKWAAALCADDRIVSTAKVLTALDDSELEESVTELNNALYSPQATQWHGQRLTNCVKRLRKQWQEKPREAEPLQLYPA